MRGRRSWELDICIYVCILVRRKNKMEWYNLKIGKRLMWDPYYMDYIEYL